VGSGALSLINLNIYQLKIIKNVVKLDKQWWVGGGESSSESDHALLSQAGRGRIDEQYNHANPFFTGRGSMPAGHDHGSRTQ
jgi:hypothetical protein